MKILFCLFLLLSFNVNAEAQCNQTLAINSFSAECNGDGTSTVTINVTVIFGNGNNSATISYNIGAGNVVAEVLEDDFGDIVNETYIFDVPSCGNYAVILSAWSNPSGSGSSCTDPPPISTPIVLPVTFGHFEIIEIDDNVLIAWSTYTETNNERFEIQKAKEFGQFETIGELSGAGNSLQKVYYEFLDENIDNGTYYYRIKQIDLDGKFSFSDTEYINVHNISKLTVYPNPAKEYISINTHNQLTYRIFDSYGALVQSNLRVGEDDRIDISNLASGMYFLLSNEGSEKTTFIKQ